VTIKNLPNDATWTVTENANEKGYTLYDLKSSDTADKTVSKANGTISNNDYDTATFTNDKGFAPQTGITMNSLGGIAIAVVAVAGGATLVISRRKRAGQDF
jgi:LPXTG-motif cell wall-anchored protein